MGQGLIMVCILCILLATTPLAMGLKLNDHGRSSGNPSFDDNVKRLGEDIDVSLIKLETYTFRDHIDRYQRGYRPGTVLWAERENIFNQQLAQALAQKQKAQDWNLGWVPGVNQFMDWTEAE